jgi:hypothetical protein
MKVSTPSDVKKAWKIASSKPPPPAIRLHDVVVENRYGFAVYFRQT